MFCFTPVQYEDIPRKTKNLNVSEVSQQSNILTKELLQDSKYFFCYFLENINYCLEQSLLFPHDLKLADVAPVY